jgi:hypothetical protein
MRRVRLYGLLLFSAAALLWGSDSYAFNRINGIIISHSNFRVTIFLTGSAINADTVVTVSLTVTTEFICINPQSKKIDPGTPELQDVDLTQESVLRSEDFDTNGHAVIVFDFPLQDLTSCHQRGFQKINNTELAVAVDGEVIWNNKNNRVIEDINVASCEPGSRGWSEEPGASTADCQAACNGACDPDTWFFGCVPHQELSCLCEVHREDGLVSCAND